MIQIDMQMPTNCHDCIACNEYLMCVIPVNGRGCGENDALEYGQSRPEWCPMKEQEAVIVHDPGAYCPKCGWMLYPEDHPHYCGNCGQEVKWE